MDYYKKVILQIFSFLFITLLTCQMDHGLEPIRSGISGTIHYLGDWPKNTAEVRIVAATKFPPNGIDDLIIGDVLPIGGDSTEYNFYVDPGAYYLGLVWREYDSAWGIQSIFGIYFMPGEPFTPGLISVPDASTIVTGKDIVADFAKARKVSDSQISGIVYFSGTWPKDIEEVRVIASLEFPPTSLLDLSFSNGLPAYVDSASYYIPVAPGTYKAIGAVIKQIDKPWSVNNIVGLIFKENSLELLEVIVPDEDSKIAGINLHVIFRGNEVALYY